MTDINSKIEQGLRRQVRFTHPQLGGELTIEQLYKLPLTGNGKQANLDDIAIALDAEVNSNKNRSFVKSAATQLTVAQETAKLKLDIVVHIIEVLSVEKEAATKSATARAQAATIREELNRRKNEKLLTSDDDVLTKQLEELEKLI